VGQTKLISSGSAKFTITHSSTAELKVDSDTPYVFAVRAAKSRTPRYVAAAINGPSANFGLGTKAAADQYSVLIDADSGFVAFDRSGERPGIDRPCVSRP